MIQMIKTYEECRAFAAGFQGDPNFSGPMLSSEEQLQSNLVRPDRKSRPVLRLWRLP